MLTIKSSKTSLLDLSIYELANVAWEYLEIPDFVEELSNPKLLTRLMYGSNKKILADFTEHEPFLMYCSEFTISKMIDAYLEVYQVDELRLDSCMFYNNKQYSLEFLEKYKQYIRLYHVDRQQCLTPEFVAKNRNEMDTNEFWANFSTVIGNERLREFIEYNDGELKDDIMHSRAIRMLTANQLIELGLPVPDHYNTVLTEQRIMSGQPCNDGQRSFTIWLRKFRRTTNNSTAYPTWNELLELYKKYPRMNNDGYIDWIFSMALFNSEETVQSYSEKLSYSPERITVSDYISEAGSGTEEDYEIEFSDVISDSGDNSDDHDDVDCESATDEIEH